MSYALKIARAHKGKVCMICKTSLEEANTSFAQSTLNTEEEAKAIEKHKKEMKDRVSIATDDAFTAYCINYHVPRSKNKQFYSLVSRREERKAAYDYIYQKSPYKRVKAKMAVDSLYEDSLNAILIPYNKISGDNLGAKATDAEIIAAVNKLSDAKEKKLKEAVVGKEYSAD